MVQTKIIQTTPEKGSAEADLTSLPEKEFKIKIINMLKRAAEKYARAKG